MTWGWRQGGQEGRGDTEAEIGDGPVSLRSASAPCILTDFLCGPSLEQAACYHHMPGDSRRRGSPGGFGTN